MLAYKNISRQSFVGSRAVACRPLSVIRDQPIVYQRKKAAEGSTEGLGHD